jgi:hypothetical protein
LLAGFAVTVTFLISNYAALSPKFISHHWNTLICLFLLTLIFGILEKMIAAMVSAASAGAAVGRELGGKFAEMGIEINPAVIFMEVEQTIFPPMRYFVRKSFQKASKGDITAAARTFTIISQVQGLIVLLQVTLVFFAVILFSKNIVL